MKQSKTDARPAVARVERKEHSGDRRTERDEHSRRFSPMITERLHQPARDDEADSELLPAGPCEAARLAGDVPKTLVFRSDGETLPPAEMIDEPDPAEEFRMWQIEQHRLNVLALAESPNQRLQLHDPLKKLIKRFAQRVRSISRLGRVWARLFRQRL